MTWSLSFEVKDNEIDAESVRVSGEMPVGRIALYGHEYEDGSGQRLGAVVSGLTANASYHTPREASS